MTIGVRDAGDSAVCSTGSSIRKILASAVPAVLALATFGYASTSLADPLPAIGADLSRTTVSGLSSGAYMAGQFQVANSRTVTGAALVAGGPYGCARSPAGDSNPYWPLVLSWNLSRALNKCTADGWIFSTVPNARMLFAHAERLAEAGKIDPIASLRDDKVYLFSSSRDDTVERGVVDAARDFYRAAGIGESNIIYVKQDKAAHAFLTLEDGLVCGKSGPPFLNDCDYDQAGEILKWLLGPLNPPSSANEESFLLFEQRDYVEQPGEGNFDTLGLAYIPQACRSGSGCAVHIVFHGCRQGRAELGDRFAKGSGYARWAESNRIALLFPQVVSSPLNPKGCWDWWGYTGPRFLERDALQMRAVIGMIERLSAQP